MYTDLKSPGVRTTPGPRTRPGSCEEQPRRKSRILPRSVTSLSPSFTTPQRPQDAAQLRALSDLPQDAKMDRTCWKAHETDSAAAKRNAVPEATGHRITRTLFIGSE